MRPRFQANFERLERRDLATAGLTLVLKTDHQVYQPGQAVVMTLTEKNTTDQVVQVAVGPALGGFSVSQDGRELWTSERGLHPLFVFERTLKPGESLSQTATWHGETPEGKPAHRFGPFVVKNSADPSAAVVIRFAPPTVPAGLNQRTHPLGGRISR